ncbi:Nitroreductase-like protein [Xylariaceae sp. FL0804]|nr:Nitroreductase-like protein [Xylariaceae sp. FL0804]
MIHTLTGQNRREQSTTMAEGPHSQGASFIYERADSGVGVDESDRQKGPAGHERWGSSSSHMMMLDEAILARHSTRLYIPDKPVPRELLESALELATHSPSNSNTQAWRLYIVQGAALDRLKAALVEEAGKGAAPNIPGLPADFKPYRSELGKLVYGEGWGIPRDDHEARKRAVLRNFDFFGAPVGVIVCMSGALPGRAAFSVGMYVQTFLLALTERGVGSCVQVSIAGYPDLVRREVGIPDGMWVLCGLALGYEDAAAGVNRVRAGRDVVDRTTHWVDE